jgi:uncharacterized protein YeaO (DUF488 family)
MTIKLSEYHWGQPRSPDEGLRLSCTRFLPRGVRKADYAKGGYLDVWLPILAPSRELLGWAHRQDLDDPTAWRKFQSRYRAEMKDTDPRQTIRALAMLATRTPISIGCACRTPHCHRFVLEKLIRAAAP